MSRILPAGAIFPYDFGSIPKTLGEDGDAVDVLVISDAASFAGCLLTGKLIGVISAEQTEKGWRDGTTHIVMSPLELMQRLAAPVP